MTGGLDVERARRSTCDRPRASPRRSATGAIAAGHGRAAARSRCWASCARCAGSSAGCARPLASASGAPSCRRRRGARHADGRGLDGRSRSSRCATLREALGGRSGCGDRYDWVRSARTRRSGSVRAVMLTVRSASRCRTRASSSPSRWRASRAPRARSSNRAPRRRLLLAVWIAAAGPWSATRSCRTSRSSRRAGSCAPSRTCPPTSSWPRSRAASSACSWASCWACRSRTCRRRQGCCCRIGVSIVLALGMMGLMVAKRDDLLQGAARDSAS